MSVNEMLTNEYWSLRSWAWREYCNKRDLHKVFTRSIQLANGNKEMLGRTLLLIAWGRVAYKARINSLMLASEKMFWRKYSYLHNGI